jgi:ribosomal protein S18 acetylase RimI-like enzyme
MVHAHITLRPIQPEDQAFLSRVYASTRMDELAPLGWELAQVEAFLHLQCTAQHTYYQQQCPEAAFDRILLHDQPIGRLYVARGEDELRMVDMALLPEHRHQGIGSALLEGILAEAAAACKPVRIHVEKCNPALRLYQRLGFHQLHDTGVYFLMEWSLDAHRPDRG